MLNSEIRFQTKYTSRNPVAKYLNRRFEESICRLVSTVGPASLLDVGCGEGVVIRRLLDEFAGIRIEGLDPHEESLLIARQFNPQTRFHLGSIYHLPFQDGSFDTILCSEVLEHLEHPAEALQELNRVARRHIILTVPREPLWRIGNMVRFKYWKDLGNTPTHIQHWSSSSFKNMVREHMHVITMKIPVMWTMLLCGKKKS